MSAVATAIVVSGYTSSQAASKAGDTQAAASDRSGQLQRQTAKEQLALQERIYKQDVARQKPFYDVGVNAIKKMQTQYDQMPAAFSGKVDLTQDPGYAFRLSEGQKALERSAAARGGLLSGGTGKALQRFGQEFGSQEYGNAYNRALTEYNAGVNREATGYNRLAAMSGTGQTAAGSLGAAGQNYANSSGNIAQNMATNVGNSITNSAAARSSGYVGQANALTGSLNTYLNYNQGQNYLNALRGGGGSNVPGWSVNNPYPV
jgi:hypothetical protein